MVAKQFIIIGQGIAGTILGFELLKAEKQIMIINDSKQPAASRTAGAVLNPHKIGSTQSTPLDHLQKFDITIQFYQRLEIQLNTSFLFEKPLVILDKNTLSDDRHFNWGVKHVYTNTYFLDAQHFLEASKEYFISKGIYLEDTFKLKPDTWRDKNYRWRDLETESILFCEGAQVRKNPIFTKHSFLKNKGDALILHIPDLSQDRIVQMGNIRLLPIGNHRFWLGTQHIWDFETVMPDEKWRTQATSDLANIINVPFQVIDHLAAERPTTPGQKLILEYDSASSIGIVNGMGSRGFTQAALHIPRYVREQLLDE